jgi:hypothetical protein
MLRMRRYYFLDTDGVWHGPFPYLVIVVLTLAGRISPTTYLWHSRLARDGAQHPSQSIYARKAAHEFRFLPTWVFASNLKAMAINTIRGVRRCVAPNEWEKFVATPIDLKSAIEGAVPAFVMPSIMAINDFAANREYRIALAFDVGDAKGEFSEHAIEIFSGENQGIYFEILLQDPPENLHGVLHQESYGLNNELLLKGRGRNLEIAKNSVFDFSTRYPFKPQVLKGRFSQVNTVSPDDYKNCYNRLMIKVEDDKMVGPQDLLVPSGRHVYDKEQFNVDRSLMGISFRSGGAFTDFTIKGMHYRIFSLSDTILLIDGLDREDLSSFQIKGEVARVAMGLMSGKYYGDGCLYVSSNTPTFQDVAGVWYEVERETVISTRRTIDQRAFRATLKEDNGELSAEEMTQRKLDRPVDANFFSALCEALTTDPDLFHAANLVISAMGNNNLLQQGALYSVALEALTNALGEKKSKDLKPIADAGLSRDFVKGLQDVLATYRPKIPAEAFTILEKNITGINRPTNRDKLVRTFELFGVKLSDQDKEAIDKRNDYLHGRNPLAPKQTFELTQLSLRLHTLIVSLLLKSCGYSGHLINLDSYLYLTDEDNLVALWSKIDTQLLTSLRELQKALEDKNLAKAKELKLKLTAYLKELRFAEFFRII